MQVDSPTQHSASNDIPDGNEGQREVWELTRAGKRIAELKEIEDNVAVLLHFAGCALASLHPDPLSSFTSREFEVEGEGPDEGDSADDRNRQASSARRLEANDDQAAEFGKYAEAYFATLNDIQVGLRTSIRHLRDSRTSPAPLIDPTFGSLGNSAGPAPAHVGVGGLALARVLEPVESRTATWDGRNSRQQTDAAESADNKGQLSLAARELEREAWNDLANALDR
ncbi:hypothetical protein JCM3766R1_005014 [Sporobolomyces carnicolor]